MRLAEKNQAPHADGEKMMWKFSRRTDDISMREKVALQIKQATVGPAWIMGWRLDLIWPPLPDLYGC